MAQFYCRYANVDVIIQSMTSSCLFNRGTTFSQTVTDNNEFLPADTKPVVYKHTHSGQR